MQKKKANMKDDRKVFVEGVFIEKFITMYALFIISYKKILVVFLRPIFNV